MRIRPTVFRLMIALAIVGLILGGVAWGLRKMQNRLTVENRTGQPISWVWIVVSGSNSTVMFANVPHGGEESATVRINGDGSFRVQGRLADGTVLSGSFGYVTNGMMGEHARFVVRKGGGIIHQ